MSLLTCEWKKLAFANYIIPPEILKKYLPAHTELDYFNGNCYASLVGFQFRNAEIAGVKVPLHTDFEEINLRFYVKRFDGANWRKGTVFITEIVDKPALSILANALFHENYKTLPTKQKISEDQDQLKVEYYFNHNGDWQHFKVVADTLPGPMEEKSEEEFLIHRIWGYGRHSESETNEYEISHPHWQIYPVSEYSINIDFTKVFGSEFSILNAAVPRSVILAEGSHVKAEKRTKIS